MLLDVTIKYSVFKMSKILFIFCCFCFFFCPDLANAYDCNWTGWQDSPTCPNGQNAIYWEESGGKVVVMCCNSGSDDELIERLESKACQTTPCILKNDSDINLCSQNPSRFVNGTKVEYIETIRDNCLQNDEFNSPGEAALCCPVGSKDIPLTTLLGVEKHEFPHFARLQVESNGSVHGCGGSIYNERFIITASHCVVDKTTHKPYPAHLLTIFLDTLITDVKTGNEYNVEKIVVHPNSSKLFEVEGSAGLVNDIALLKLAEDIRFGEHIKAIPIAKPGFEPLEHGDYAVIVGFGITDTGISSKKLQKANVLLRMNEREVGIDGPFQELRNFSDQFIFLGGFQDGLQSLGSGKGDSGGPAICRNEHEQAVLCGLDSKGKSSVQDCIQYNDEKHCYPTAWVKVSYFHDWIVSIAGDQEKAEVMRQPLYGEKVEKGQYENQVYIKSADGYGCGGTLVSQNAIVTAAHCVVNDNGSQRMDLKVIAGIQNSKETDKGKISHVRKIKVLDGFKRVKKSRVKRVAAFAANATFAYPNYENDLAVVLLSGNVTIDPEKLAKISKYDFNDTFTDSFGVEEIAFIKNAKTYGQLSKRNFRILSHSDCQVRLDHLSILSGYHNKLGSNMLCGVEKYLGGSLCDREVGGGLFCVDENGKEELCGVQTFRLCNFAVPSQFLNVKIYNNWIQSNIK